MHFGHNDIYKNKTNTNGDQFLCSSSQLLPIIKNNSIVTNKNKRLGKQVGGPFKRFQSQGHQNNHDYVCHACLPSCAVCKPYCKYFPRYYY